MSDHHSSTEDRHLEARESVLRRRVRDAISRDLRTSPGPSMDELIQRGAQQIGHHKSQRHSAHQMRWALVGLVMISWMMTRAQWPSDTTNDGALSSINHTQDQADPPDDVGDGDNEDHLDLSGPLDFLLDDEFGPESWVAVNTASVLPEH